jgi:hypothetical protein
MASPVIATQNGGRNDALATSITVNLPASIAAGDTLLALIGHKNAASTTSFPAGWTIFNEGVNAAGSLASFTWAWRKADGTEGATISVTIASSRSAHITLRVTGATDPTVTPPEAGTAVATNNTNAPDPPTVTPTGGSKDYLFLACFASSAGRITTTQPTSYNSTRTEGSNSGTTTNVGIGVADRALTASSENPGTFLTTGGTTEEVVAGTVAVHPTAAAAAASLVIPPMPPNPILYLR